MQTRRNLFPWRHAMWLTISVAALLAACAPTRTITVTVHPTATVPPTASHVDVLGGLTASGGNSIAAHDIKTGKVVWSKTFADLVFEPNSAQSYGTTLFITAVTKGGSGVALALDATNGNVLWRITPGSASSSSTTSGNACNSVLEPPAVVNATNVLFVAACTGTVFDFDSATGKLRWTENPPSGYLFMGVTASMVFFEDNNANVLALDVQTGAVTWNHGFGPAGTTVTFAGNAVISATSPGSSSTTSTASSPTTTLTIFDATTGQKLWSATFPFGQYPNIQYAVDGTTLLVADPSALSAYDLTSGKLLWRNGTGNLKLLDTSPTLAAGGNGVVLATDTPNTALVAIREQDGTDLWTIPTTKLAVMHFSLPIAATLFGSGAAAQMLFVTFGAGAGPGVEMTGIDLQNGTLLWQSQLHGSLPGGMAEGSSGEIVTATGMLYYSDSIRQCSVTTQVLNEMNGALLWSTNQTVIIPADLMGC